MAQKKQISAVQGFTHGLVTDPDPRFQIKGSYSKALNVRLTNKSGDTFTVENIDGNTLAIDLFALQNQSYNASSDGGILKTRTDIAVATQSQPTQVNDLVFSEIYFDPDNTDDNGNAVGLFYPSPQNPPGGLSPFSPSNLSISTSASCQGIFPFFGGGLPAGSQIGEEDFPQSNANNANIVGSISLGQELYLVIVKPKPRGEEGTQTIFLRLIIDSEQNIERVEDLGVCYSFLGDNYPDLNMDIDSPIRLEALIENETITRLYWTDNKNPLRTLNVKQRGKNQLPPNTLNVTPMVKPSQPTLDRTINGNLPTGVYQYTYKYISANGGETTFSPLSNLYHTSEEGFGSSTEYGGSPQGEVSSQGFRIAINDVDSNFQFIELYALLYESKDVPPRVALVDRRNISLVTGGITISHLEFEKEIENGLEEVLIETNTWDLCKDIAIKDNILFAANLRQKQNTISEKEWNVKVLRYTAKDGAVSGGASVENGMITCTDIEIETYHKPIVGGTASKLTPTTDTTTGDYLLGKNFEGDESQPMYGTLFTQRPSGGTVYKTEKEYRFLRDGLTLGAESYKYGENFLGGCRVSFGVKEKIADITTNDGLSPYIDSIAHPDDNNGYKTDDFGAFIQVYAGALTALRDPSTATSGLNDFVATNTTYRASMNLGGSKDPHLAGNLRGYQRGEFYRFGVQIYDLNGSPGNVLWIGDIQTPEMYDVLRMINVDSGLESLQRDFNPLASSNYLSYFLSDGALNQSFFQNNAAGVISHPTIKDHRLTHVYGHSVPPVDVCWFSGRGESTIRDKQAYIYSDGTKVGDDGGYPASGLNPYDLNPAETGLNRAKFYPGYAEKDNIENGHTDYHYLYDLYVNFEFIIPQEVCNKISGFRVVRAERQEDDRRVLQQGLLNQTMKYGFQQHPTKTVLEPGYDDSIAFSKSDNENYKGTQAGTSSNDFPFINVQGNATQQLEYDSYLNGYVGLAENTQIARYDGNSSQGVVTSGATAGKIGVQKDNEVQINNGSSTFPGSYLFKTTTPINRYANQQHPGMGAPGEKHMRCNYFGSYEKCQSGLSSGGLALYNAHPRVPGTLFTLDSPDSAFGTIPYSYREGDILRIDSVLKLTDERRYVDEGPGGGIPQDYYYNGASEYNPSGNSTQVSGQDFDGTVTDSLRFSSKRQIDLNENYGILIGKYYVYDTYWGIGLECDKGDTYGHTGTFNLSKTANPENSYRQYGYISAAIEVSKGAVLPGSFFKNVEAFDTGDNAGFSNNTLGFISDRREYAQWGAIDDSVTKVEGGEEGDINYDTASTMQQGLRTIVLSVSNNPDFNPISEYNFHVRNVSAILQNQSFYSRNSDGTRINASGAADDIYFLGNSMSAQTVNSLIPYKYLCSIVRKNIPFGGSSRSSIEGTRYIPCGNFHPVKNEDEVSPAVTHQFHNSKVFGGDTFVNLYAHQKTNTPYMANSYARWQVFPVESFVNTDMRGNLNLNAGDTILGNDDAPQSNDWDYNEVYSQENTIKSGLMINEKLTKTAQNLPYEIAYSNTKILGEIGDAFRIFPINQFHDMEGTYGEINRIVNYKNDIYVLQDEAFAKLLVNPLSVISDDTGQSLFTGTGDTVENHIYISTKFGTRHTYSVTTSEQALYFVDSRYARIFKYDTETLISLGDSLGMRGQLRDIIKENGKLDSFEKGYKNELEYQTGNTRNYRSDNPLKFLGINSIFDHKYKELMVCFHNSENFEPVGESEEGRAVSLESYKYFNIVYNEGLNAFTSYYSAVPNLWLNADPGIFTTGHQVDLSYAFEQGLYTSTTQGANEYRIQPLQLWKWDSSTEKSKFFGKEEITQLEKTISENPQSVKVFDTGIIAISPSTTNYEIKYSSEHIDTTGQTYEIVDNSLIRYREGQLRFPLRQTGSISGRTRGQYLKLEFTAKDSAKFNIFAIMAKYRKSYN